ncbi:MAG TPA: inositol monophosphatase family protein, partial [Candidatus Thermoplasmatota archaeon]|nr:inositol monophosphatase family protein [Candidatus Thermoplasmatota archaeon]
MVRDPAPAALAAALADAAYGAWQRVKDRADRHDKVGVGAGGNPTSKADDALEKAILRKAKGFGLTVLSEEAGLVGQGSDLIAVVDPLDGSRNAGRGIPFHCTSVAVGKAGPKASLGGLQAGVVRNLVTGDTYAAAKGKGATLNGKPVRRSAFDP